VALQSKVGDDRIFERVAKAVEPMLDGVCQKWDCVTHWYPPNMIVTKDGSADWAPRIAGMTVKACA
jgi:hypothetical protein